MVTCQRSSQYYTFFFIFKEEILLLLFFLYLKMGVTYQSHLSRTEQLQPNKSEPFTVSNA